MTNSLQWVVIAILFIAAVIYLINRINKSSKGHACEGASCNCGPKLGTKKASIL